MTASTRPLFPATCPQIDVFSWVFVKINFVLTSSQSVLLINNSADVLNDDEHTMGAFFQPFLHFSETMFTAVH